jgi:hypothetical protein
LTVGKALLALAGFWTLGVVMVGASAYGSVGLDHFRQAPTCTPGQVFTPEYCRITVDATLTALTREQVEVDVGGRRVTPQVKLHGPLPGNVTGLPVRVTFYEGAAVHVEGGDLNFDTDAAPVDHVGELRAGGLFFLVGGTLIVGIGALIRFARRAGSR